MKLSKLSKREKSILLGCAAVVVVSILYNLIFEPLVKTWSNLNKQIKGSKLKLKKGKQIVRRSTEIAAHYDKIASFIPQGKGSDEEEITNLLSEIEQLARSAGSRITDIKPRKVKDTGYYKRYIVEVESEGDINGFTKFIYEIQNSSQLLKVEKLSIGMTRASGGVLKANMVISKILP